MRFGETLILYRAPPPSGIRPRLAAGPPANKTATAVGLPAAVFLSEVQQRVLDALCTLVDDSSPTSGAAADQELADQLALSVEAVRENLWALSHVFDAEELPEDERVARIVERARRSGVDVSGRGPRRSDDHGPRHRHGVRRPPHRSDGRPRRNGSDLPRHPSAPGPHGGPEARRLGAGPGQQAPGALQARVAHRRLDRPPERDPPLRGRRGGRHALHQHALGRRHGPAHRWSISTVRWIRHGPRTSSPRWRTRSTPLTRET